jgi:hypothetical protein
MLRAIREAEERHAAEVDHFGALLGDSPVADALPVVEHLLLKLGDGPTFSQRDRYDYYCIVKRSLDERGDSLPLTALAEPLIRSLVEDATVEASWPVRQDALCEAQLVYDLRDANLIGEVALHELTREPHRPDTRTAAIRLLWDSTWPDEAVLPLTRAYLDDCLAEYRRTGEDDVRAGAWMAARMLSNMRQRVPEDVDRMARAQRALRFDGDPRSPEFRLDYLFDPDVRERG